MSTSTGPSTEAQASVEFSEHIRRILVGLIGHVNMTDEDQQTLMLTLKKLEDAGPRSIKQRLYFIFFEGSFIKYLQIFFKKSSILFHVFFKPKYKQPYITRKNNLLCIKFRARTSRMRWHSLHSLFDLLKK